MYCFPIYGSFADMYMKARCLLRYTLYYKIKESLFFTFCMLYKRCCFRYCIAFHAGLVLLKYMCAIAGLALIYVDK